MTELTAMDFRVDSGIKSVVEARSGDLILEGYANTWVRDRDDEVFVTRAFAEAIPTYVLNPILCLEHDRKRVIGVGLGEPEIDDVGVRMRWLVPQPPPGSEPWHVKAFNDIRRGVMRALSVGGKFFRKGDEIVGMDWRETSVVAVPSNPCSVAEVIEQKGLKAALTSPSYLRRVRQPGVGRGHGAHPSRGGRHLRRRARRLRRRRGARHVHRNGVMHRHAGGRLRHSHRKHVHASAVGREEISHAHTIAWAGHSHPTVSPCREDEEMKATKAAPEAGVADEDPAAEAQEIQARGAIGELLQGLLEAIDEIVDNDTMTASDKVDAIEDSFEEFVDEARAALGEDAGEDEDEEDTGKAVAALADLAGQTALAAKILDRARRIRRQAAASRGDMMGEEAAAEQKATSAEDIKAMAARLEELERERREQQMVKEAEAKAAQILEEEAKAASEAEKRRLAEEREMDRRVREAVERHRANMTTGRQYRYEVVGEGQTKSDSRREFVHYLRDIRDARRGMGAAWERASAVHTKAAQALVYEDSKALSEGVGSTGGFLVPPEYWQQGIAEYRIPASPIRQLVPSHPVTGNQVYIPRVTGPSAVAWVAENATKPSTDQTFGQIAVGIWPIAGISKVSNQMLDDSNPAVEGIVRKDLGRFIGQSEDLALLNGDGNGKPLGILQTTGILNVAIGTLKLWQAISAAITTVTSTYYGPPTAVVAPPNMVGKLRDAVDANGRPILQPGFMRPLTIADNPYPANPQVTDPVGTIHGLPIYVDANMPQNLGAGSNETRVIVGAFDEAVLLERQGITIDVSDQAGTSWESNQTWFRGEARIGFTAARQPSAFAAITGLIPANVS